MNNIFISIFIILFIILLLHGVIIKTTRNNLIEGFEDDDENLSIKDRFKKLQNRVNQLQNKIESAEKSNNDNKDEIFKIKKENKKSE
jgi:uncharacterized protein YlxW (UPF0749 family)